MNDGTSRFRLALRLLSGLLTAFLVVACADATAGSPAPVEAVEETTARPAPAPTVPAASSAPSSSEGATTPPVEASQHHALFSIPPGDSPEPTPAEWSAAPLVNSNTTPSRETRCEIAFVREWARATCKPSPLLNLTRVSGKIGKDFWFRGVINSTIIIRLTPGSHYELGAFMAPDDIPFIRIVWPSALPGPLVAEATRAPGGALAVRPQEPQPIPSISEKSDRPLMGDWATATPVNTGSDERRPKNCEALVSGGWLKWRCAGGFVHLAKSSGFGKLKEDHFITNSPWVIEGESRLVRGMGAFATIQLDVEGPAAELVVFWPSDAPRPAEISFELARR